MFLGEVTTFVIIVMQSVSIIAFMIPSRTISTRIIVNNNNRRDRWNNINNDREVLLMNKNTNNDEDIIYKYEYDGWNLTYRYKEITNNNNNDAPSLFLIHPVGIGLSSWFWKRFLKEWNASNNNCCVSSIYAPDLIGCGIENGGTPWNPDDRGMFFPLTWARACEALMLEHSSNNKKFIVVTNGALARLGVSLTARNPSLVSRLVLCSPPSYQDMTSSVPQKDIEQNLFLLRAVQSIVFPLVLDNQFFVRFFSNLFLFSEESDDEWLEEIQTADKESSRSAVIAFNAGVLEHRSYEEELEQTIQQPALVLIGKDDAKIKDIEYEKSMKNCKVQRLNVGQNVLPYEAPIEFKNAIQQFIME